MGYFILSHPVHISRHLEFIIEQGHRVSWVSGSLDSRVTESLGHTMWPSSMSGLDTCCPRPVCGGCRSIADRRQTGCTSLSVDGTDRQTDGRTDTRSFYDAHRTLYTTRQYCTPVWGRQMRGRILTADWYAWKVRPLHALNALHDFVIRPIVSKSASLQRWLVRGLTKSAACSIAFCSVLQPSSIRTFFIYLCPLSHNLTLQQIRKTRGRLDNTNVSTSQQTQ